MIGKIVAVAADVTAVVMIVLCGLGAMQMIDDHVADQAVRAAMQRVETQLLFHGYPVDGFAQSSPTPDLELVDAMAPPDCKDVWRTAQLAQVAIVRQLPLKKDESGAIGAWLAIAHATDIGRLDCVGLAQRRFPQLEAR